MAVFSARGTRNQNTCLEVSVDHHKVENWDLGQFPDRKAMS